MNPYLRWTLRVVAQFVVAGGLIRALDAWILNLDPRWQFTAFAAMQLAVAFAHAFLDGQGPSTPARRSVPRWNPWQLRGTRADRLKWRHPHWRRGMASGGPPHGRRADSP